jgi:MPBQ/MSBQ methyltransferase
MDADDLVRSHYSRDDLVDAVLEALRADGVDTTGVAYDALAPIDNLHAGFLPATLDVIARLSLDPGSELLDIGCGVGGPARAAAATTGARVVGVDLSPDFVATGRELTRLVALDELVAFETCTARRLPFEDDRFDAAMMIHVGMNVPDKQSVFGEVARTTRRGGRFVVYDQMQIGPGALVYPLPWADDARSSFVAAPEQYVEALEHAGFRVENVVDRTAEVTGPPTSTGGSLNPGVLFGDGFAAAIGNNVHAAFNGILGAVVIESRVG